MTPPAATQERPATRQAAAVTTLDPRVPQYMKALDHANSHRLSRSDIRAKIKGGEKTVSQVLLNPPACMQTATVYGLLMLQRGWGDNRVKKFLAEVPMSHRKTIGSLTPNQRVQLTRMLAQKRWYLRRSPSMGSTPSSQPVAKGSFQRSRQQRMDALARANAIRIKRAQLKRDLKARRLPVLGVVLNPPDYCETMKVFDLLLAVPKHGRVKANKILAHCRISPSKTMGGLSERQRGELVSLLHQR